MLSSCGVTLESVVQSGLTKDYTNILIVIPFEKYETESFVGNLKRNLEEVFALNNKKTEILLLQVTKKELTLNSNDDNEIKMHNAISKDNKDLIIIFKPVRMQYYNYSLQSASYQILGVDLETKKEIWKANFSSTGYFGPSTFAKSSAEKIFQKLKNDKILKN